jgi:Putative MetA-pathway of phenol degradation
MCRADDEERAPAAFSKRSQDMNCKRIRGSRSFYFLGAAGAILLLTGLTGGAQAQGTLGDSTPTKVTSSLPAALTGTASLAPAGEGFQPVGCSTCGSGLIGHGPPDIGVSGGCSSCGGCSGGSCNGQKPCDCCCDSDNCFARLFCGFYKCVCCPDPCYEPQWNILGDTAFFQDAARPVTQMRLRYEHIWDYPFPDKSEFLFPRSDGNGIGPAPRAGTRGGGKVNVGVFTLYNEVARGPFSASIDLPYEQVTPDNYAGASGFGDMVIGTKSMLLDCELMQFSFGFKTFIPTGNFSKGLGTGHVSLEPELLLTLKLAPTTYLQSELAYRFPLGGDGTYEGPVLHYHVAVNQLLWNCGHDIKLVGTLELNGYELLGGSYTSDAGATLSAKDISGIVSIGPGIRLEMCDRIDFGIGTGFNFTSGSMGDEFVQLEFRWRF